MSRFYFNLFSSLIVAIMIFLPTTVFAQSNSDKRIDELEKQIKELTETLQTVTEELKEIKMEKKADSDVDTKVGILAEEIDKLKSFNFGADRVYESRFGLAPGASQVYQKENPGISFGGYGEIFFGSIEEDDDNILDAQRVIIYTGYKFNDRIFF